MPKLPRLTAKKIEAVLEKRGFFLSRQSGSHKIYKNEFGRRTTVPAHGRTVLHPKTLRSILRDVEMSIEDVWEYL